MIEPTIPPAAFFFRSFALFAILPLGFDLVSIGCRICLALLAVVVLVPVSGVPPDISLEAAVGNIMIGIFLGLPCALLFHAAQWFGEAFDTLRGQTIGSVMDPFHSSVSATSQLCGYAIWVCLLCSGVLVELLLALQRSFEICPDAALFVQSMQGVGNRLIVLLAKLLSGMMLACLPFAIVFVGLELCFGFLGKVLPGVSFTSESFQAKFCFGFALLAVVAETDLPRSLALFAVLPVESLLRP
ncbi:MAG: flagellar biosynthetic protein FliR [Deltaproteobacteria bacterium]|nr:flagellar biosynthetic protein FliR [Deltaproteobacteria bacterium]